MRMRDRFPPFFWNLLSHSTYTAPTRGKNMDVASIPLSSYKPLKGIPRPSDTYRGARRNAYRRGWRDIPLENTPITNKHRVLARAV